MADKDKTSPATTSDAYDLMLGRWELIDTLLSGTEAMRAAGQRYLPKHTEETDEGYRNRLASAVLFNVTEQTLDSLVGKPFRDGLRAEEVPEAIMSKVWEDVDLQGNDAEVFAKAWFRCGLAKAFAHVLVDMPKPAPKADGSPRTLADDAAEGRRPYWVFIQPERLLFARAETVNGVEVLKHVRLWEEYTTQDGFAEVVKQRIRVLEPGKVQLWEPTKQKRNGKTIWAMVDEWGTGLDVIPFVTFYAAREALCVAKPPLLDLAHLNVAHWQSDADQRHILTVARFPILACSGAAKDDSDRIVVGPNQVLYNPDPQGKFYYVEHQGNAIEAGRKDLEDLEQRMATYGAQFLQEQPGARTATETAIDTAESTSLLADFADKFEDAMAQVLALTAMWMGDKTGNGGEVELNKDYTDGKADPAGLEALHKARERRDLSRAKYLAGLQSRGVLPDDFDDEENEAELADELTELMGASGLDLNPGAPGATPAPAPVPSPGPAARGSRRAGKKA